MYLNSIIINCIHAIIVFVRAEKKNNFIQVQFASVPYAVLLSVTMLNYAYCIHGCLAKEGKNNHPCEETQTVSTTVKEDAAPTF